MNHIDDRETLIAKINEVLKSKKDCVINIINDKLTLSVFSLLEENLSRVRQINFIIRDSRFVPAGHEISREFELDANPSDALFNHYDIIEKNKLRHFSQAKSMHEFIQKHVHVRRVKAGANIGVNILIIDDDFLINGSSSLEIAGKASRRRILDIHFDTFVNQSMDSTQIVRAKNMFEQVWHSDEITEDYKDELLKSLGYVYKEHTPEFLYYFTLHELFGNQLDFDIDRNENDPGSFKKTRIWNMLYNFQKDAVLSAIQKLNKYNGCIIADSVGLGKTFEALAVIKYFEKRNDNVLVLTPAKLYENWLSFKGAYKDSVIGEEFNYKIMFHTDLSRYEGESRSGWDLARFDWSKFDLLVIDESHNFRNRTERDGSYTRYQRLLEEVIREKQTTKVLLLSATPVNNSLVDLKNQISLITADRDDAFSEHGVGSIGQTLRRTSAMINLWDKGDRTNKTALFDSLPSDFYKILELLTISRSRKHITQYYQADGLGKFPEKLTPDTYTPDIDTQDKLLKFTETNVILESLKLSLYTPMLYIKSRYKQQYREKYQTVHKGKAIFYQENRELMVKTLHRFNLFKRLESSVFSFGATIRRLCERIDSLIALLTKKEGALSQEGFDEDIDDEILDYKLEIKIAHLNINDYLQDLYYDKDILEKLLLDVETVLREGRDKKIAVLKELIRVKTMTTPYNAGNKKVLVFTAFADTAEYLYHQMESDYRDRGIFCGMVSGSRPARASNWHLKQEFNNILSAFSPVSRLGKSLPEEDQISIMIGTDCISEGQNLQDCDCVINYDIHWNPVTLIQRFGRIDRIGSRNEKIKMINFFPHVELNEYLNLENRIKGKMLAVNIASTGDENLLSPEMNDMNFRKRQLERLQKEVIDIDEASDNISLVDLNMNEYLFELYGYVKKHPELKKIPRGVYSVTETGFWKGPQGNKIPAGVIFCFKHQRNEAKPKSDSSLYPYYLIYISREGEIVYGNQAARELLKTFRGLSYGKSEPSSMRTYDFLRETADTKNMTFYSSLLSKAIESLQGSEDVNAEQSIFDFSGFNNMFANETADDFELVSFLVVYA